MRRARAFLAGLPAVGRWGVLGGGALVIALLLGVGIWALLGYREAEAARRLDGQLSVVITDISPQRLELAAKVADVVPVNVAQQDLRETMNRLGMREGFDVGLEMSGAPAALEAEAPTERSEDAA